ncbi:MAG: hypothetical protein RIR51_1354 [Bacteroidota bacterium]|jgi:DNA repair protein RadA/Sms
MAKTKTSFICQSCGYNSPKWLGKCPTCQEWNSFIEEIIEAPTDPSDAWKKAIKNQQSGKLKTLDEVSSEDTPRILTGDFEFDRVLGGGIVPGSLILIGGEPGIGKSTLLLQIALQLNQKIIYISGEESEEQIKLRAERIGLKNPNLYLLKETNTQNIFKQIIEEDANILIVDSIQTLFTDKIESGPGSVSQIRECTVELMRYAKETNTSIFVVGHITKEGTIAGPKVLEHLVDTVLQFEGDQHLIYRILRTIKNRFGNTAELGIYEMLGSGLRPVNNPSEILLSQRDEIESGMAVGTLMEGNRPLMIEIQSLVGLSNFGNPQRTSTGFDSRRLSMLIAVLEKKAGLRLGNQDVFLNITGGIKVSDPALDLSAAMSIISSYKDKPISKTTCFAAELGLGGELRSVTRIEQRIAEAEKIGFTDIWVSKYNVKKIDLTGFKIRIHQAANIGEVVL